jgi:hypothetical protein
MATHLLAQVVPPRVVHAEAGSERRRPRHLTWQIRPPTRNRRDRTHLAAAFSSLIVLTAMPEVASDGLNTRAGGLFTATGKSPMPRSFHPRLSTLTFPEPRTFASRLPPPDAFWAPEASPAGAMNWTLLVGIVAGRTSLSGCVGLATFNPWRTSCCPRRDGGSWCT